jgi:integral membrane protein
MTDQAPHGSSRILTAARAVSLAEATSFLLLLVATGIKYGADHPQGVRVLGPIHGVLFLAYCALVGYLAFVGRWTRRRTVLALVASVLPVAPFFVERHWLRGDAGGPGTPSPAPAPTRADSEPAGRGR